MNKLVLGLAVVFSMTSICGASVELTEVMIKFNSLKEVTILEVSQDPFDQDYSRMHPQDYYGIQGFPYSYSGYENPSDGGKIISTARDLVALGQEVYSLVTKGRPSVSTTYTPISVLPKGTDGKVVDLLETEGWKSPKKATYEVVCKNYFGMTVVKFRYSVFWSYGGSYNGLGRYITSAQIVPEEVFSLFGFDFSATMKLGGIQNIGSKENPIAGATLLVEHSVNTIVKASTNVHVFFITGSGKLKKL